MKTYDKIKCSICGELTDKKVFWKKYCSAKCRRIAHALKEAKEMKMEGGKK